MNLHGQSLLVTGMDKHLEKIYFAPMEGITTKIYRAVHKEIYSEPDVYFSPFIAVSGAHTIKKRDINGVVPFEDRLVPQIMTKDAKDFVWAARMLSDEGYSEVNLNAGCPSSTVVTKGKGAGLLEDPRNLRRMLEGIFEANDIPNISIKIRAGFYGTDEAEDLAKIISDYPFCEVIIHPRAREDFYAGKPDMEAFDCIAGAIKCPVCYNGDLKSADDVHDLLEKRPWISRVMIGRGLIADPGLGCEFRSGQKDDKLSVFLARLKEEYVKVLSGERDVLFKLKEIWGYIGQDIVGHEKELKAIKKSVTLSQYDAAVRSIMRG